MKRFLKVGLGGVAAILVVVCGLTAAVVAAVHGHVIPVLEPKGLIAQKEYNLLVTATLLMLIVVVPVFVMTFWIAWRYRASNKKAQYRPDWDHNHWLEGIWWGIPLALIAVLSVMTWTSSHELDPYRRLASDKPAVRVQVVALEWKWLFLYPDLGVASVNEVRFPAGTAVDFEITGDAPMNSFWIPQLGGQIYAMAGMTTPLHLIADGVGNYTGASANLSGEGFAGMKFTARSVTKPEFDEWVAQAQQGSGAMNREAYDILARPSQGSPVTTYALTDPNLYDEVVMKYKMPAQ